MPSSSTLPLPSLDMDPTLSRLGRPLSSLSMGDVRLDGSLEDRTGELVADSAGEARYAADKLRFSESEPPLVKIDCVGNGDVLPLITPIPIPRPT
jgi:hypothetical protein